LGRHVTAPLEAGDIGRLAQVDAAAAAVRRAMAEAAIQRAEDVHFVQIKCPLLTAERIEAAGGRVATHDTLASMGLSRGAAALGVAVALGEVDRRALTEDRIGTDTGLFSARASCSAGIELMGLEVVVMGMSAAWAGPLAIDHAVMADAIDVTPVRDALRRLGLAGEGPLAPGQRARVRAVLAKAEASKTGRLRGYRHTMRDDSDIAASRHARAFVGGALAAQIGHGELYVSGGAEHQGPDGGGPCAVVVARPTT
jgi:cyanuric acid amidohydrolase